MNNEQQELLEDRIRAAVGSAPRADFDAWQLKHANLIATSAKLNRGQHSRIETRRSDRRWRLSLVALATALLIACLVWFLLPREPAFANTIRLINQARSISWVSTFYERLTSNDGKRYWLQSSVTKAIYMEPGFYRFDRYAPDGTLSETMITDPIRRQKMILRYKNRTFDFVDVETFEDVKASDANPIKPVKRLAKLTVGPFGWLNRGLQEGGEIVGQKKIGTRTANVLRWKNLMMGIHNPKNVTDVWIDAQTQELIGVSHPGSNVFDPETLDYRNNPPEENASGGKILGSIENDIQLDVAVDPAKFEFTIPAGFTRAAPPKPAAVITEGELIEWIEVLAKVNDLQFPDGIIIRNTKKIAAANAKPTAERTDIEKQMGDIWRRHLMTGNADPLWAFIEVNTFPNDFRYVGNGVKLGSADKIVLLYRLKSTGKYRAVYGDLRVEEVSDSAAKEISHSGR